MRASFLLCLSLAGPLLSAADSPGTAQAMGLLKANCLGCHNAEKKKGGLSLETRELALQGGEHGGSFMAGKASQSRLIHQLAEGSDPHMPPKKQLAEKHIALLRSWIDAGAPWDEKALHSFGAIAEASSLGPLPAVPQPVTAIALSPDGTRLASTAGNAVVIRDVSQPERPVIATLPGHRDAVQSIAWSADGKFIATGGYRTALVFDAATWELAHTLAQPLEGRQTALAFLPDNETLALADGAQAQRGLVHLWKITEAKPSATLVAHSDNILSLAVSHDGKLLATGGADNVVKVWDLASRRERAKLEGHTGHVLALAFNKDGTWLATGAADKELKIWDVKTKDQLVQIGKKDTVVTGLHWSAKGGNLIVAGENGKIHSYTDFVAHTGGQNTETAKERKLPSAEMMLHSVTSGADGKVIFAGADDGVVFAWESDGKLTRLEGTAPVAPDAAPGPAPLSFTNDILPILGKAGCNTGACHAKASGQAGLKLSVFAFDPRSDHAALVKADRGRRVFPALPEESLLLKKPSVGVAHEGGQRFEPDSPQFRTIAEWIRQGAPYQIANEPQLAGLEVSPAARSYKKLGTQPLKVTARYSDGTTRDVTALAEFVSNDKAIATVNDSGLVKAGEESGEAVIITRYMGRVAISRVAVPSDTLLPEAAYAALPVRNEIDRLVYARLKTLGHLPSEPCGDAEFLRRSTLDATGSLPTVAEARAYLASSDPEKRSKWIEHLLDSPAWADHWAIKWGDLIRPNPSRVGVKPVLLLDEWIRQSFRENKPWDQFVRELLTAQGGSHQYGPVAVWRDKREPVDAATFVGQLFLGVRLECAKCHHHPNEKWDQADYYQLAAFFTAMKRKGQGISAPISGEPEYWWAGGESARITHPVTGVSLKPRPPDAAEIEIVDRQDPRAALVDWMTRADNPYFAKAAVNRVWNSFFGRGIVDPVDDFRASNPPSNEPLLDWLAADFIAHRFDLKHTMRTIMRSQVYQLGSLPNDTNKADLKNYSRSYRRRLPAEVLLDAVSAVTESADTFGGMAQGATAKQTWNVKLESEFMDAFGRPNSSAECPCERDAKPSVVQALHLMNSSKLQAKLNSESGRAARLAKSPMTPEEIVEELYLAAFSRPPAAEEREAAAKVIAAAGDKKRAAIEDVLWALLNSAEFVFNH
jgi:WD40 repeat protein